jgi:ATP-binding cassette, subfamily F, member 2
MPVKKKVVKNSEKVAKDAEVAELLSDLADSNLSAAEKLRQQGIITTYAISSKKMHRNVRDISVENITILYHGVPLLEEADLSLNYGNRYGLIGRNGCGKSTLMSVIGSRCIPIPDGIDIFHLKEEIPASDMSAKEAVMSVDAERQKLETEAEYLSEQITLLDEGSEEVEDAMDRLNQIYDRLEELDAATAEARASRILSGLGFTPEMQAKRTREFSGGWRMRISLARALFIQPTLLLLDEPTNHLDMEAVVWLEDYLSKWNKILLLVSHSQDFLNNVCTHMINFTRGHLNYYTGNYDSFVKTRSEKEEEQEKIFKREQDQINHMKDYIARFGQGNAKMARQAQSKEKVLDKMLKSGLTEKVQHEKALDFKFPNPGKLAPPVLQCNDITFGYPGCPILFANVSFGIDLDSRVALVGPNGKYFTAASHRSILISECRGRKVNVAESYERRSCSDNWSCSTTSSLAHQ